MLGQIFPRASEQQGNVSWLLNNPSIPADAVHTKSLFLNPPETGGPRGSLALGEAVPPGCRGAALPAPVGTVAAVAGAPRPLPRDAASPSSPAPRRLSSQWGTAGIPWHSSPSAWERRRRQGWVRKVCPAARGRTGAREPPILAGPNLPVSYSCTTERCSSGRAALGAIPGGLAACSPP